MGAEEGRGRGMLLVEHRARSELLEGLKELCEPMEKVGEVEVNRWVGAHHVRVIHYPPDNTKPLNNLQGLWCLWMGEDGISYLLFKMITFEVTTLVRVRS